MTLLAARSLRALPALLLLAIGSPAAADSLAVAVAPDVALDADQVKSAIAAELGASIVEDAADLGAIDIHIDPARRLVVEHRRPDGTSLVRVVALPALPADRLALIAFVTGNLVRDQLADLGPAAAAAPTPADVPAGTAVELAPPVELTAPGVTAVTEVPERTVPLSIGLVPPLSTDRLFTSRARVRGAINVILGASSSVDGISISGVADLSAHVRGRQIGGAATLAGDTVGVQLAGAGAAARDLRGVQIAGAAGIGRDITGIQIAGAATAARSVRGIQIAGAGAVARSVTGLEIAGGAAVAGHVEGAQIAAINVAGSLHGVQLGAINVARHARGLQLGAINISDESDGAQIGVLNFVRKGRTDIDAWAETTGLAALALRHGGRYVHNIYAIGFTPDGGETPLLGLGIGTHHRLGGATLDLDAMAWQTHMFGDGIGLLSQARATLAIDFGSVAGFVAAAYNVSVEDAGEERPLRTMLARTVSEPMSDVDVAIWPSLSVGVRGHLGARR
jgi:hypothetical protein